VDDTEVHYMISTDYEPASASGVRWNDPAIAVRWPLPIAVISERDRDWPTLDLSGPSMEPK
jgi:dTDP-4-dehydrorhamnose 3,5-epimerase